jgi:hypothetical protein
MKRSRLLAVAALITTVGYALPWTGDRLNAQTPVAGSGIQMQLVEQRYSFTADQPLHLVYRLTGDLSAIGLTPPASPDPAAPAPDQPIDQPVPLSMEITNYSPITSAAGIDPLIGSDIDRLAFGRQAVDGVTLDDVRPAAAFAADGSVTLTLDVPTDVTNSVRDNLKFPTPGLYPVRAELFYGRPDSETLLATRGTIVQRVPTPAEQKVPSPPINLAVIGATTTSEKQSPAQQFDGMVALAATLQSPITMQVSPTVVADAASTEVDATALQKSLTDDEFVAQPGVPVDVSSMVAAGRSEQFARQLTNGEETLTTAVPTVPVQRAAWFATDPLSAPAAQELRDLGFRYIVMPQRTYRATVSPTVPATDQFVNIALPDGGFLPLLVVDSVADDLTTSAADRILLESTPVEWAVGTISSMILESQQGNARLGRSHVLSTPDLSTPDPRLLQGLEDLASTTADVRFSTAAALTGTTDTQTKAGQPVSVTLPATAGRDLSARVALLDGVGLETAGTASMLPEDDPRPAQWAAKLDGLISTSYSDAEVTAATHDIQAATAAIRAGVELPNPFTFTMTGRSGDIELRVRNNTDEALKVVLRLDSSKFTFPGADDPSSPLHDHSATLRPNSETSVTVPVQARANGTAPITVQLLTPTGQTLGEQIDLTSRVTAFTGLGQVLTAGLLLVLLSWWFAHWRARRRELINDVRERHPSGAH